MVAPSGIEPPTQGFSVPCSTDWATEPYMAVRTGIGPATFCVTGRRGNHCTTGPNWLREQDLNLWPPGYEPSELPDCSIPRYLIKFTTNIYKFKKWRRKRDSNPCAAFTTSRFSRPIPSTGLGYSSKKNKWCLRSDLNRHEG